MLCAYCEQFALDMIEQNFESWTNESYGLGQVGLTYRKNDHVLTASTYNGCELCEHIKPSLVKVQEFRPSTKNTAYNFRCQFREDEADRAKSVFELTIDDDEHSLGYTLAGSWQMFRLDESKISAQLTAPNAWNTGLPRQVSPWPDSPECIALIRTWLEQCEKLHTMCTRPEATLMPTRVIDVGEISSDTTPRLIHSTGRHERYLTLSYCWGKDGNVVTTKQNIGQHLEAMDLQSLPSTLRDAILMTRKIGFRYLWIDALCIIQDDAADWEREAANMCAVYEGSALSLSALDSPSSNSGFITPRQVRDCSFSVDGTEASICKPFGHTYDAFDNSPLEKRAWTFQERVLAPAIPHFGSAQVLWECCTGLATESEPTVRPQKFDEKFMFHDVNMHDIKKMLQCQSSEVRSADLWYRLVEQCTRRALTVSSDRLPAISGLLAKFER